MKNFMIEVKSLPLPLSSWPKRTAHFISSSIKNQIKFIQTVSYFVGYGILVLLALTFFVSPVYADGLDIINIDFNNYTGKIRCLHGTNLGPPIINEHNEKIITEEIKALNLPIIRYHDAPADNRALKLVDISQVFPLFHADPQDPKNYYFAQTDDYIKASFNTGAQVSYRFGETIEHSAKKYFIYPPEDYEKWADICINIIRHYNEGWANGFFYNMDYWHIWEEPDNPKLWAGSWGDFIQLYVTTAKKIKQRFPNLKVGGPAMMDATGWRNKDAITLVDTFLTECRLQNVPLDFFSWNCYGDFPDRIVKEADDLRRLLDRKGFIDTELHLAEWHYWPESNDYETRNGIDGAAYLTAFLTCLQDTPVEMACYYTGSTTSFGLFHPLSKEKNKCYYGMKAFSILSKYNNRVRIYKHEENRNIWVLAGQKQDGQAAILVSCLKSSMGMIRIELENIDIGEKDCKVSVLDAMNDLQPAGNIEISGNEIILSKPEGSVVYLIELT